MTNDKPDELADLISEAAANTTAAVLAYEQLMVVLRRMGNDHGHGPINATAAPFIACEVLRATLTPEQLQAVKAVVNAACLRLGLDAPYPEVLMELLEAEPGVVEA